jgi:hypothetical protein
LEPVNHQLHIEFEALSAVPVQELTQEEWALLQIHLAYCPECAAKFEQYQELDAKLVPALAANGSSGLSSLPIESEASFLAAEQRLMKRLNESQTVEIPRPVRTAPWKLLTGVLAACTVGLTAFVVGPHLRHSNATATIHSPTTHSASASVHTTEVDGKQASTETAAQIRGLREQLEILKEGDAKAEGTARAAQEQLATDRYDRSQMDAERNDLKQQLVSAQADAQSWKDKATSASSSLLLQASDKQQLENKINLLTVSLAEKENALDANTRMLALDKDFLAHDRDIRDLIGARNLYIADIFDTTESGKTAKPFGRIFYTKDRSLVFYGFDLDKQPGFAQSASFQVWGSGSDKLPVSLGMFYQDDSHKRWVLRCNDEKALARLNLVFVTIEPPGGSTKPTGKQLLKAYLQIPANHP